MPGSPPMSTSEPGTRPPPSTRESSAMSTGQRSSVVASTLESSWGTLRGAEEASCLLEVALMVCSAKLFHTKGRGLPVVAIQREGSVILMDCGEGVQRQVLNQRIGLNRRHRFSSLIYMAITLQASWGSYKR